MKFFARFAGLCIASIALISTTSQAQDVMLRGKVEDVPGTNQFFVDCTNVALQSSTIDLNAFLGLQVELHGTNIGTTQNPRIDVTSIKAIPRIFEVGGNGSIGRELQLQVVSNPGDQAWLFADVASGFAPAHSFGTFLLAHVLPPVAQGTVPATGVLQISLPIPNNPNLVGLEVFGQALVAGSGVASLSNADCKTISR